MSPRISIIIPCYNEQATIRQLLEAIYRQSYPRAEMEVVIADGNSEDATRDEIIGFKNEHPDLAVRIVDNTGRSIPSAINCAILASAGEMIVRMDAHSQPYPDYVEHCVSALDAGLGDNVGGVWEIKPGGASTGGGGCRISHWRTGVGSGYRTVWCVPSFFD
jgi:succinoglycan biosynthesis protein ExoA